MKRNEWLFTHDAEKVLEGAKKKHAEHSAKLKWWTDKQAEIMKDIRDKGVEINESPAASYSNKSGRAAEVVINEKMKDDLYECHSKITNHTITVKEYAAWIEVLTGRKGDLQLNQNDYLYFFGM